MAQPIPQLNYAEYWHIPEDGSRPTWKKKLGKTGSNPINQLVGSILHDGSTCRIQIKLFGKRYHLSRILYYHYYGEDPGNYLIDHKDGNALNNHKDNLRKVDHTINAINRKSRSKHKITGIYAEYKFQKWDYCVQFGSGQKNKHLRKHFPDFFEACCYRKSMEVKLGYEEIRKHRE